MTLVSVMPTSSSARSATGISQNRVSVRLNMTKRPCQKPNSHHIGDVAIIQRVALVDTVGSRPARVSKGSELKLGHERPTTLSRAVAFEGEHDQFDCSSAFSTSPTNFSTRFRSG